MTRNLESLFKFHAQRDLAGDGCFRLVNDVVQIVKNDSNCKFEKPKYLEGLIPEQWEGKATEIYGNMYLAWIAHIESHGFFAKIEDYGPGDIGLSASGQLVIGANTVYGHAPMIGVISAGYELVCRTNFGLTTVSPIALTWRVII